MTTGAASLERPIRVLQLVTTMARGGAQATVVASSSAAPMTPSGPTAATGFDVRVLAGADETGEGTFWGDPVLDDLSIEVVPDLLRSIRPAADARALRWLVSRLRTDPPDVLHTHSSKAGVLGRLAAAVTGVPSVHTIHGWGPIDAGGGAARRAVIAVERLLARKTTALVVVGRGDLERGLALGIGGADQYRLIRSGIELPEPGLHRREDVRRELELGDRFVVGMVGRLAAQKDQATLLAAFAMADLAEATLVLVGDGPERPALEAMAARWPWLDMRFLGPRPDGPRLVAGFDLAVNASNWEGLPRSVVEAAAAGVPVVASDVGSTSDLIRPGSTGRLAAPGDVRGLATALVAARNDAEATTAMAAAARVLVGEYSAATMRAELHRLWADVADGRGVAPSPNPNAVAGRTTA